MKRASQDQTNVLYLRNRLLSRDPINSACESNFYDAGRIRLLRGRFLPEYGSDCRKSKVQKKNRAAEAGTHGDSVAEEVIVRQILFGTESELE